MARFGLAANYYNLFFYNIMKESNVQREIMLVLSSKVGAKIFRNNTGTGWQGKTNRTTTGALMIHEPRPLRAGLCKGSSDLIGWTPTEITPEMVGKTVAIFTAIEVKQKNGRVSKEQTNFLNRVQIDGGLAGVARSENESIEIVSKYKK